MGTLIVNPYLNKRIVTGGLVLHLDAGNSLSYPGSGTTWFDLSGNGNNGTLTNGPTFDAANGGSVVFDGVNDYVICSSSITYPSNNLTAEVWAYTDVTEDSITFSHYNAQQNRGWLLFFKSDGTVAVDGRESSTYRSVPSTGFTYTPGAWVHMVFTQQLGTWSIYANGIFRNSANFNNVNLSNSLRPTVGAASGNQTISLLDGGVAIARIYNRALTAAEINQNFQATRGRFGI